MNETEWLTETWRPQWMGHTLSVCGIPRTKAGRRKLRLFACGCCRVVWELLPDEYLRAAVDAAERFADGRGSKDDLADFHAAVQPMTADDGSFGSMPTDVRVAIDMAVGVTEPQAFSAAFAMLCTIMPFAGQVPQSTADRYTCDLFRCVFGNPFRPPAFENGWRTSTVVALAEAIYADRAFDRLPVLADALQDAGCEDAAVLGHCRGTGPHARGCWVVDAVLGVK